mmetsp:Transcript_20435/g.68610  ORF Transcript_20435/g.68610 Transcript_20435/m.68610 type:complete len:272 (-) Transcript_20435:203-1018(-)
MPRAAVGRPRDHVVAIAARWKLRATHHRVTPTLSRMRAPILLFEALGIASAVQFGLGSVFFLPSLSEHVFWGCILFITGSVGYAACTIFDFIEERSVDRNASAQVTHALYSAGAILWVVGTVFFFPSVVQMDGPAGGESGQRIGAAFFIIGSMAFVIACFTNRAPSSVHPGAGVRAERLVLAASNSEVTGSILFLVGSVFFLPDFACNAEECIIFLAAWLFIVGSVLFVVAQAMQIFLDHALRQAIPGSPSGVVSVTSLPLVDPSLIKIHR